jgi:hypothetical protein
MATYYVSASGDNSDGTTWAKAYTTLVGAYTAQSAAGHTYVVDSTHSESGASLNLAIPGTIAAPSRVLGATNTGSAVVAADLVNAKGGGTGPLFFSTTTSTLTLTGLCYWEGIQFNGGQNSSATGGSITTVGSGTSTWKNCHFALKTTGGTGTIGMAASSLRKSRWFNCSVELGATTQGILLSAGRFEWFNTDSAFSGSDPANGLFSANSGSSLLVSGVDLSAIDTATAEYFGGTNVVNEALFVNCELSATPTNKVIQITSPVARVAFVNCHASGNYVHEMHQYQGKQEVETTIVRTGGASDGTTPISWKITPTANNEIDAPFDCFPITIWNDVEDVSRTVTIEGIWSHATDEPTNNEIWMDVEYLADASTPQGAIASTAPATVLTTATLYDTSAETWGGSTTPFKMTKAFTPLQKGFVTIRIYVAKASETFYICPKAAIANT